MYVAIHYNALVRPTVIKTLRLIQMCNIIHIIPTVAAYERILMLYPFPREHKTVNCRFTKYIRL